MISLSGPDRIVAVMRLDEAKTPTKTALFSRRELRRALDLLDALDPEDQRIELALVGASAPVLVARPYDPTGEGWVAVAGHSEAGSSSAPGECSKPEPAAAPAPKEGEPKAKTDNFDTGFPGKPVKGPVEVPVKVGPAPEPKAAPTDKPIYIPVRADPASAPKPAPKKEEKPAPAAEDVCEECGGPVSKTQKQMSQLFLNKTLCKNCLDKLSGGQA